MGGACANNLYLWVGHVLVIVHVCGWVYMRVGHVLVIVYVGGSCASVCGSCAINCVCGLGMC